MARWPVALLGCGVLACTSTNPDYFAQASAGCSAGDRSCVGTRPIACAPSDGGMALRSEPCPGGATCAGGLCVAATSATPCATDRDCDGSRVCMTLVDAAHPGALAGFCLAPEGLTPGGQPCVGAQECRTDLCLSLGAIARGAVCYRGCQRDADCPARSVCRGFDVTITGVSGTVRSCAPL